MDLDFIVNFDFLTVAVSTFVGMFIEEVFKPIKNFKGSWKKVKYLYSSLKYGIKVNFLGYPSFEKLSSIQKRKRSGEKLTTKEEKLYEKHIRPAEEAIKPMLNNWSKSNINKD